MFYQIFSHNIHHRTGRRIQHAALVGFLLAFAIAMTLGTTTLFAQTTEETATEGSGTENTPEEESATTSGEQTVQEESTGTDGSSDETGLPAQAGEDGTPGESTENTADTDESAQTGGEQTEESDGTAEVATGDAAAAADIETDANENDTQSDTPDGTETTVENENDATASTTAAVDAGTGDNEASASHGAGIDTGNAVSTANVVNVINTNIFNAQGLIYFLNVLMGNIAIDLRHAFSVLTGGEPDGDNCTLESCDDSETTLTISNQNAATVNNDVAVTAATGDNSASASAGDATVSTGDAYASANVVNLVNTNITGSNYLLLTVNSFNANAGNIVFPGADWFNELLRAGASAGSETTVSNTNEATIGNTVAVGADTGDNAATGTSAAVSTGDATAAATVVNQVNTNILGDSIKLLFRVHGNWSGEIFGLPEGMSWQETRDGIEIMLDPSGVATPVGSTDNLTVTNNNTATVTNNVSVYALTGDNKASAGAGNASVTTGDAQASANVVNVVNTNVLGRNWVLAIFNIFGDWSGNIAFGQPDLWVGARALTPSNLRGGTCFDYEVTVNNLGDAAATNVALEGSYNRLQQRMERFTEDLDGRMRYHIGRIAAGGSRTILVPTCLSKYIGAETGVNTAFTVNSDEDDADNANNTESIGVVTIPAGGGSALRLGPADLAITKTVSNDIITASSTVDYKIIVTNKGDPVYNALLIDTIYNESEESIHEQRWGLDTIHADETIIISYSAFFNGSTTPGVYTNEAFISGTDRHPDYEHNLGNAVDSPVASVDILVTAGIEEEEVEEEVTYCDALLTQYIRYGEENDTQEVSKLQYFLRTVENDTTVNLTGEYDAVTYNAVHAFQRKYASEVLIPWGIAQTTGYVYYTTQKKVNELWCEDRNFPLSPEQKAEITAFKSRAQVYEERGVEIPEVELQEIGLNPEETESGLALTTEPAARIENTEVEEERVVNQVAAAGEALADETTTSVWSNIRERVSSMFSWMSS